MSNILLQIVAISWFVNIIESVESVNYICPDTHKLIQRKLTILGVYDENESVINFNQKSTEKGTSLLDQIFRNVETVNRTFVLFLYFCSGKCLADARNMRMEGRHWQNQTRK